MGKNIGWKTQNLSKDVKCLNMSKFSQGKKGQHFDLIWKLSNQRISKLTNFLYSTFFDTSCYRHILVSTKKA